MSSKVQIPNSMISKQKAKTKDIIQVNTFSTIMNTVFTLTIIITALNKSSNQPNLYLLFFQTILKKTKFKQQKLISVNALTTLRVVMSTQEIVVNYFNTISQQISHHPLISPRNLWITFINKQT